VLLLCVTQFQRAKRDDERRKITKNDFRLRGQKLLYGERFSYQSEVLIDNTLISDRIFLLRHDTPLIELNTALLQNFC